MSAVGSEIFSIREEIKTLKRLVKIKRTGEDLPRLEKEPRPSDEQNTLFDKNKTSIPAFQQVFKVGKQQYFLMLP